MNHDYYRTKAIIGARPIATQYGLERCIHTCKRLCNAIDKDNEFEEMRLLHFESDFDPCLDLIISESMVNYGARNLLSAFYYWANDDFQSNLWFQVHVLGANRVLNKPDELNDR